MREKEGKRSRGESDRCELWERGVWVVVRKNKRACSRRNSNEGESEVNKGWMDKEKRVDRMKRVL